MEKRVDAALTETVATDGGDKAACPLADAMTHVHRDLGCGEDTSHSLGLVHPTAVPKCRPKRRSRWRWASEHDALAGVLLRLAFLPCDARFQRSTLLFAFGERPEAAGRRVGLPLTEFTGTPVPGRSPFRVVP